MRFEDTIRIGESHHDGKAIKSIAVFNIVIRANERGFSGDRVERKKTRAVKVHRNEEAAEAVGERNNYGL